jgi:hypothetical protein
VYRTGVAVLRPGAPLTKEQVIATIRECRSALSDDMLAISTGVACNPFGEIDLLALDRAHQITIVDVETASADLLFARGLSHVDWVVRNMPLVQRLYPAWAIDTSRQPRLALVAPQFPRALRSAIHQIARPAISCFRYRELDLAGGTGLFIERLDGE